jgi:hypothetical protein
MSRNEQAVPPVALMSYPVAFTIFLALVIGIIALNVSHRRHRSRLTKPQTEKEGREHEVACSIW